MFKAEDERYMLNSVMHIEVEEATTTTYFAPSDKYKGKRDYYGRYPINESPGIHAKRNHVSLVGQIGCLMGGDCGDCGDCGWPISGLYRQPWPSVVLPVIDASTWLGPS